MPAPASFPPDAITVTEVLDLVDRYFPENFGDFEAFLVRRDGR